MNGKNLLITHFTAGAGIIDGILDTSSSSKPCSSNNTVWNGISSATTTTASFLSGFPFYKFGVAGGGISAFSAAVNIGVNKQITANDLFTLLAGLAGAVGVLAASPGMAVAAAVFTVSGIAVSIHDSLNHRDANGCIVPPAIPLGPLAPPPDKPNTGGAEGVNIDPLIIDMNGDGIKTISKDKNIFFDLDNNGFAENTAWVDQNDALLVWDRNNNDVIDSGEELFGNHTTLQNGNKAKHGFEALAELDSNQDQIFDENDETWTILKIWIDKNQNGISEEDELINLADTGIKKIELHFQNSDYQDENNNDHKQRSQIIWQDGRITEVADIWFDTDNSKSYFKENIEISDEIKAMPNVISFGNVLNLHQAMVKNHHLIYVIEEYINSSIADKKQLINNLIFEWTETTSVTKDSRGSYIDARKVATLENLTGQPFLQQGRNSNPTRDAAKLLEEEFDKFADYVAAQIDSQSIYKEIFTITSFNINEKGELEFDWSKINTKIEKTFADYDMEKLIHLLKTYQNLAIYNQEFEALIKTNLTQLAENNPILKSVINHYIIEGDDSDNVIESTNEKELIYTGNGNDIIRANLGDDTLIGGQGNDILKGGFGADTYLFSKGHGQDTIFEDSNYSNREHDIDTLQFIDVNFDEVKFSRESNDLILFGYYENDSIRIKNFYVHQDYQIDRFIFADKIVTRDELKNGNVMRLYGTNGDDEIIDWQGNSILIGEKGNDILRGNFGADTYLFSKGHGQDTIFEDGNYSNREHDIDTLQFIDVNFDEVKFSRENNDLILFGYSGNDSIRVKNFYVHEDYQIDHFIFADQTLTRDELKNNSIMKLYGTENNDIINDWQGSTTIFGGDGDDMINAVQGDDTLIGGQGNDILKGGFGADTYLFSKGHGQDTIFEDSNYSNRDYDIDSLIFTDIEDISDLYFSKNNNDLIIQSLLQKDKITIKGWYNHNDHKIEQIKFANSAELNIHQTEKLVKETMEILPQYTADNFSPLDLQQFKSHINQVIEVL